MILVVVDSDVFELVVPRILVLTAELDEGLLRVGSAGKLELCLLDVVLVDVNVSARPNELARLNTQTVGKNGCQDGVRSNVEGEP